MTDTQMVIEEGFLPEVVAEVLFGDLKRSEDDSFFRREMFARRVVAAQFGRSDAVEWAYEWYGMIVDQARQLMEQDFVKRKKAHQERLESEAEFRAGRCGNPYYQAFLDTLERPADLQNNAPYLVWHIERSADYERLKRMKTDTVPSFGEFLRDYTERHLSERVKAERAKAVH